LEEKYIISYKAVQIYHLMKITYTVWFVHLISSSMGTKIYLTNT